MLNIQAFATELNKLMEKDAAPMDAIIKMIAAKPKVTIPALLASGALGGKALEEQYKNWKMGRMVRKQQG